MMKEGLLDLNEAVQYPGKRLVFNFFTALSEDDEIELVEPLQGHIEAVSAGSQLQITTACRGKCILDCARCGVPIEAEFDFDSEDWFEVDGVPSMYATDGHAKIVSDEPTPIFKNNTLLRDAYIRQEVWVNLPTQPLCAYGWEGTCPNDTAPHELAPGAQTDGSPFSRLKGLTVEDEK